MLVYDKEEPVTDNLITWVFDENSFVPAAKLVGDKSYSILTDHLGTPYEAYDENGEKVWARELDIYGNAIAGDSSFIPFLYQGQYYDEEIGLAYNRFRYYSPESGTYISQDPIRLARGLAFYGYVFDCNGGVDIFGLHIAVATYTNSNGITGEVGSFPSIKNISHSEPQILEQMGEQKGGHLHIFSKGPNGDDTFTFFRKKGSSSSYPAGSLSPCSQCDALLYNHSKENDMLITYHWKDKLGNEHIRVYHPDGSVFENGIDISSKYH